MEPSKALKKFIIVSNRLPVSVSRHDGKLVFTPSPGGLATAMSSVDTDSSERLWIGWPGISADELLPGDRARIIRKLQDYNCYPVFLTKAQVTNFYEGYSNDTIWPMFHYFQSLAKFHADYWEAYKEVNALFSKAVTKQSDPQASIWVHDYHLMLLPGLLRDNLPNSAIGFFLHIPFPSYEIFRLLPNRRELLHGLLGAELIGFHIYDYARHFLTSTLRILGLENNHGSIILADRVVKVDAFPIGIDYDKFKVTTDDPETLAEVKILKDHYRHQKIILSVDRLDYSKGILKRLEAFEYFLKENPKYWKKVVLVVIAVPSRTEVETYKDLRDSIEQTVSRINGKFASVDWTPISYQFQNLPFKELVALYSVADVGLVTPTRDGMNLVAKEFVASHQRQPGVLVLSEMTGAIDELPEALRVNPNDTASMVAAIKTALGMPKWDQHQRLAIMQRRLALYTVQRWTADFMEQLNKSKSVQAEHRHKVLNADVRKKIIKDFVDAKKRLVILDYDGTLHEMIASQEPRHSAPSIPLRRLLRKLADQPGTKVCIMSGRPRKVLETWFGDTDLALVAEHGAWVKDKGEWSQAQFSFQKYKKPLMVILKRFSERTPGATIEEKEFGLVWHYRNVVPELAHGRADSLTHELNQAIARTDLGVYRGHKIIEIKPRSINKGSACLEILAMHPADFIIAIGDDYTDEAMFEGFPEEAFTIKVGLGKTYASYQVASVDRVLSLLNKFNG
ncbi:MAG: bifunctional alpha,alpha-trehalose-phosphate synthase (UDP-forming)/trehalose-phosphatase [Candidatus Saccharimonadales bacterium]